MAGILGLGSTGSSTGGNQKDLFTSLMFAGHLTEGLGQVGGIAAGARQDKWAANTYLALAQAEEERARMIAAQQQGETRAAFAKAGVSGVTVDLIEEQNARRGEMAARMAGYGHRLNAYQAEQDARAAKFRAIHALSQSVIGAAGAAYSLFPSGTGAVSGSGFAQQVAGSGIDPRIAPLLSGTGTGPLGGWKSKPWG